MIDLEPTAEGIAEHIRRGLSQAWWAAPQPRPVDSVRVSVEARGDWWYANLDVDARTQSGPWIGGSTSISWDTKEGADVIAAAIWERAREMYVWPEGAR